MPIIDFIKKEKDELDENGLTYFLIDKINIPINSKKIMDSIDNLKKDFVGANDANTNEILERIDGVIDDVNDLDEGINEKVNNRIDKLFDPFEKIIDKLRDISEVINEKMNNVTLSIVNELDEVCNEINKFCKELFDKALENSGKLIQKIPGKKKIEEGITKAIQKGGKLFNKGKSFLKDKKISGLMSKLQSLYEGMNKYEQSSQMDETITILDDIIINELINILTKALQNSKIGKILTEGSKALLKEMESAKNDLRTELKNMAILPEKNNSIEPKNALMKTVKNKVSSFSQLKLEKVQSLLKNSIKIFRNIVSNKYKNNFKYPKATNTIIYINSKIDGNPFKKILLNQLKISLEKLRKIIPKLSKFLKNIISILKCDEPFSSIKNLVEEFSNDSLSEIKDFLAESVENLKIGLLSLIKNLILGKSEKNNCEVIVTWSDYFIKGIKICNNISEAEALSEVLIQNEIISINGELNKDKILDRKDLRQIKIRNFPLKLKIDIKGKFNKMKSNVSEKIGEAIKIDPKEKIKEIINGLDEEINIKIKQKIELITSNCSDTIKDGCDFILDKVNECKKLIENKVNDFIEEYFKDLINFLSKLKYYIEKGLTSVLNDIKELYNSFGDKIENFENSINGKIKDITQIFINKIFGDFEFIKSLKEKIKLNLIIDKINNSSKEIYNLILDGKDNFLNKINEILSISNDFINIKESGIIPDLVKKINNLLKSFLFRFNNDIKPVIDNLKNLKIEPNKINAKAFLIEKINISINALPIMGEIKEKYKEMEIDVEKNLINKKDNILNTIGDLIASLWRMYDTIKEKETLILDKIFEPCFIFIEDLKTITQQIENKINNVILPIISSIIKDYIDKIRTFCLSAISNLINKVDNYENKLIDNVENKVNSQLIKYEQKAINFAGKAFSNMEKNLKKINFVKVEDLFSEFQTLCKDIQDYDEKENESEIINELCERIQEELKKMIDECIKESELNKIFDMDYSSFIKYLGLNN